MTPVSFLTEIHLTYIGTTQGLFPTIVKPKFYEFIMLALLITGWGVYSPSSKKLKWVEMFQSPFGGGGCTAKAKGNEAFREFQSPYGGGGV